MRNPNATPLNRALAAGASMGLVCVVSALLTMPLILSKGRIASCYWSTGSRCDYVQLALTLPLAGVLAGAIFSKAVPPPVRTFWQRLPICIVGWVSLFASFALANLDARTNWLPVDTIWVVGLSTAAAALSLRPWRKSAVNEDAG